jgi:hypothetical protein
MKWSQRGGDIDGEAAADYSGLSVSVSSDGSRLAVGAHSNDGSGNNAGRVRVFGWSDTSASWVQLGANIDGDAAGDNAGLSVSLCGDGSTVAVGSPSNDAGHVRVFVWSGTSSSWLQLGNDIVGERAGDDSGLSVSLSFDGSAVAVGAPKNDANGRDSGHARVYDWASTGWTRRGYDIDGEARTDNAGHAVSLSGDGLVLAVGAYANDGNGRDSGHVRVLQSCSGLTSNDSADSSLQVILATRPAYVVIPCAVFGAFVVLALVVKRTQSTDDIDSLAQWHGETRPSASLLHYYPPTKQGTSASFSSNPGIGANGWHTNIHMSNGHTRDSVIDLRNYTNASLDSAAHYHPL